jgi:hypothetical protein
MPRATARRWVSRRRRADRTRSRASRATTVVSQPSRFPIASASVALRPHARLLHDVLRLADVAEFAVREPQQPRASLREALGGGHAAIRPQLPVPARMRDAQPLAAQLAARHALLRSPADCSSGTPPEAACRSRSRRAPDNRARAENDPAFAFDVRRSTRRNRRLREGSRRSRAAHGRPSSDRGTGGHDDVAALGPAAASSVSARRREGTLARISVPLP